LTRIFCAALEDQKPPSGGRRWPACCRASCGRAPAATIFYVENGRLTARANIFPRRSGQHDPHLSHRDAKKVDVHPARLRTITRSL